MNMMRTPKNPEDPTRLPPSFTLEQFLEECEAMRQHGFGEIAATWKAGRIVDMKVTRHFRPETHKQARDRQRRGP